MPLQIRHINYYAHAGGELQLQPLSKGIERIEILTKGRAWIFHEGKDLEVRRGNVLWHREGESPIHRHDREDHYQCLNIVCHIEPGIMCTLPRISDWYELEDLDRFCRQTQRDFESSVLLNETLSDYVLSSIKYQMEKSRASKSRSEYPLPLKNAVELIEKAFRTGLDVRHISEHVGLSITHLHELFRTHLKTSPHQMILKLRLAEACQLLSVSSEPIKKIASESGFSSSNSFCRSFKQHKKITPDQYRKKYS